MRRFVDANIFIRYLTGDHPEMSPACRQYLSAANEGQFEITTSEAVISEIVFVLSSPRLYALSREEVAKRLLALFGNRGLVIEDRAKFVRAIDIYARENIDFTDALIVAAMEHEELSELVSYDKHFNRFKGIVRLEPPSVPAE